MRLIDADALIKNLDDAIQDAKRKNEIGDYWEDDRSNLLYYLDNAPTIDAVEVVHGEWIDKGWKGDWEFETGGRGNCWHEYECSECGFHKKGSKSNYCPNCGADMRAQGE